MNDLKSITLIKSSRNPTGKWSNKGNWTIWNKTIKSNMGILTGNYTKGKSLTYHNNGITVIKVDVNSEFLKFGKTLEDITKRFNTFSVKSVSGSIHFYFKYENIRSKLNTKHKIDILNDGCFVVSPNSSIGNKKYEIINDVKLMTMPKDLKELLLKLDDKPTKRIKKTNGDEKPIHEGLNYYFNQPEEVINKLPIEYFQEYSLWLKMTSYCKMYDLKALWEEKSKNEKNYNKDNNEKLWNNLKTDSNIVDELVSKSTTAPPIYYKLKDITKQIIKPDVVINQEKLGYTFIHDILKKHPKINTLIIKSDTGTGKTTSFGQYIKDMNMPFLSLVSRVSLGAEQYENVFSKRFGLKCEFYKNTDGQFQTGQNVVIQVESLMRLFRVNVSQYVIFLDELNSLLEHLMTSSTFDKHRTIVFTLLQKLVSECKLIIGTDADISDICFSFMEKCGRNTLFIQNTYKHNKGVKSEEIGDLDELVNELSKLNKFVVCCDSKTEVDKLYKKLEDDKIKVFTSDTTTESINLDDYDKVIYSPKIIYGLDSSMVRPVYCVFNNMTISPAQMLQQIARVRNISYLKYCFLRKTFTEPRYENVEDCHTFLKESRNATLDEFSLMKHDFGNFYLKLLSQIEYKNDCYNVNKLAWFKKLLVERGFNDKTIYFAETKLDKSTEKELKEQIKQERLENFKELSVKVNEYLQIPEDKLENYKELFADPYVLQTHFNIRKFFFKLQTPEAIKGHITNNIKDFAVNISSCNESKMYFIRDLLNKSKSQETVKKTEEEKPKHTFRTTEEKDRDIDIFETKMLEKEHKLGEKENIITLLECDLQNLNIEKKGSFKTEQQKEKLIKKADKLNKKIMLLQNKLDIGLIKIEQEREKFDNDLIKEENAEYLYKENIETIMKLKKENTEKIITLVGCVDKFKPEFPLNKADAKAMWKRYTQVFRDRTKKEIDLSTLKGVQDILKKCYSSLFGSIITTKRHGKKINKAITYTTIFDIDTELFEYHKTLIEYSAIKEEVVDEDITFIDSF